MELDYFLVFTVLAFIVIMFAVFGNRTAPPPYGDQFPNAYSAYTQQQPAAPPQQPIIIVNNKSAAPSGISSSGGEGFAIVLAVSLAIYFYVTDMDEKRGIPPAEAVPAPSTPVLIDTSGIERD